MSRGCPLRRVLAVLFLLSVPVPGAWAQWFGAGSTVQGDYLHGVGAALYGAGYYNLRTAQADRIAKQSRWEMADSSPADALPSPTWWCGEKCPPK